jgi:hypothetical protein
MLRRLRQPWVVDAAVLAVAAVLVVAEVVPVDVVAPPPQMLPGLAS